MSHSLETRRAGLSAGGGSRGRKEEEGRGGGGEEGGKFNWTSFSPELQPGGLEAGEGPAAPRSRSGVRREGRLGMRCGNGPAAPTGDRGEGSRSWGRPGGARAHQSHPPAREPGSSPAAGGGTERSGAVSAQRARRCPQVRLISRATFEGRYTFPRSLRTMSHSPTPPPPG